MKGIKYLLFICFIFFVFSACVPEARIPYGVWVSEMPSIKIYVYHTYQIPYRDELFLGIKGEDTKILITVGPGSRLIIYENTAFLADGSISHSDLLFVGDWVIVGNQMHYTLTPALQERTGYELIIFNRAEDYEPINPADWIQ